MPKKNNHETPRWNQAGDPVNDAAVLADVKSYLNRVENPQPKEKTQSKNGQKKKKTAEVARWNQNGDPINDAAVMADIERYLNGQ